MRHHVDTQAELKLLKTKQQGKDQHFMTSVDKLMPLMQLWDHNYVGCFRSLDTDLTFSLSNIIIIHYHICRKHDHKIPAMGHWTLTEAYRAERY